MIVTPIARPLRDEHLVAVWPPLGPEARDHWNRRLRLFSGRSLSDAALTSEQAGRAGRLATYGQARNAGVVQGLEVALEREGEQRARFFYRISTGQGLTVAGEDVAVARELRVNVLDVPVCAPAYMLALSAEERAPLASQLLPRVVGPSLGKLLHERDEVDPGQLPELPRVGVLLLQPITLELVGESDPQDTCERDPANDAYEDWQLVDGARLVWYTWPTEWHPLPRLDGRRRNRIAHTIFTAETGLGRDDVLPWEPHGVPLGLVAFNRQWKPLFFDRYAVVREGGGDRERTTLVTGPCRALARARFRQFVEQLADTPIEDPQPLVRQLRWLPPIGILPLSALEPRAGVDHFFPSSWRTEATPVPLEELDAVLQPSAALAPFDLCARDEVEVLVPVPHAWYEPELLVKEIVDPIFGATIDRYVVRRGRWLRRRDDLSARLDALDRALGEARGARATRVAAPEIAELEAIYSPIRDVAVHRWATRNGFVAGLWNHEDSGTRVGVVCLPASAAGLNQVSAADFDPSDLARNPGVAANRWAKVHGYAAGFLIPETEDGGLGVVGIKLEAVDINAPTVADLQAIFPANLEVAANRWALAHGYVAGVWNHEGDGAHWDVVCFHAAPADAEASDTEEYVATSGLDPQDPELSEPEQEYGTAVRPDGAVVSLELENLRRQLRTSTPLRGDVCRVYFPRSRALPALDPALGGRLQRGPDLEPSLTFRGEMTEVDRDTLFAAAAADSDLVAAIKVLFERSHQNEVLELDKRGLADFIDWLQHRVDQADDRVDLAFARVHTDIYRVRQKLLGNEGATKLATSPALAMIAQGMSAPATEADIETFVKNLKSQMPASPPAPPAAPAALAPAPPVGAPLGDSGGDGKAAPAAAPQPGGALVPAAPTGERFSFAMAPAPAAKPVAAAGNVGAVLAGQSLLSAGVTASALREAAESARVLTPVPTRADIRTITAQSAIVGKALNFRTLTLAERLLQPAAPEARDFSVSNKAEVLRMLTELEINVDDLQLPGFYEYEGGTLKLEKITVPYSNREFFRPVERRIGVLEVAGRKVVHEVLGNLHDLDPADGDESAFFSAGVRSVDHVVAILRLVEGRIQAYRKAIELCQQAQDTIRQQRAPLQARLAVVALGLAQARQDVAVARALLDEERRRVAAVNQRRDQIVEQHVPYLAFRRPRTVDLALEAPARRIDPGISEAAVPACLAEAVEIPYALGQMMAHVRDAPASWFRWVHPLLDRLDQPQVLIRTVQYAQVRATTDHQALLALRTTDENLAQEHESVRRVLSARQDVASRARAYTAQLDVGALSRLSWANVRQCAVDALSVGDLAEGGHGRADVARTAAEELDHIAHVGGCLCRRFGEVLPAIRLGWAELLGQYDDALALRNLSALPRWGELELDDRREVQGLVDWLYGRVEPASADAQALLSDFVRLCILVASHAPVDRIVGAQVEQPTTVQPGGRLGLLVDALAARVGMHVVVYAGKQDGTGQVIARGVVEDLDNGHAAARIVETISATVNVAASSVVHLVTSASPVAALAPAPVAPPVIELDGGAKSTAMAGPPM